jgi:DNA-directed RNA polymerase-3 subunit RPC5
MSHVISGRAYNRQALQSREMNGGASGSKAPSRKGDERPEDSKDHAEDSEPWISLTYQPAESNIATKYHDKMISNEGGPIDFTMSNSDYVMSLCPGASTRSKHINKCQAIREMLLLPLEERLKKWFTEVSEVNQFDALKHLAPTYSEEEILKVLPDYAYLVRGLWVCKSSLLFDDGYASKRDRILLEFTKSESIPEKILGVWIKPDDLRRKRILFPLCKRRGVMKDYKFISSDLSFLKRYPHIVNEQECAWSTHEMTIRESLEVSRTVERKTKNSTRPNVASKGLNPNTSKGRDGPAQVSDDHVHVLGTVFAANKVRSMQAVVRDLRQLAAKYASNRKDGSKLQALCEAAKSCASLSPDELKRSISLVAVNVHDVFVARHEQKRTVRNVLILLFRKKEPNATLTKQEILATASSHLKREISDKEYHQAVTEICISTEDGHLVLKSGDEP